MEMGLTQVDAVRRLSVSNSVVQRLLDQLQSENLVSRKLIPGRARVRTSSEYLIPALPARRMIPTSVPQLISDNFVPVRPRTSPTKVRIHLHNQKLYGK
ncbi:hypothetical protein AVEN_146127-1 [Araneus ventricosus]|uniref:Uncharacterized protein n=1 Tax=Araneus ventricosus TaxID=182803 RepID=A0A4Y2KLM7_ARAVE|nr:hypothetical protein AVEN_146127-1 [Araneus ventricosus]